MTAIHQFFFDGHAGTLVFMVLVALVLWVAWVYGFNRE